MSGDCFPTYAWTTTFLVARTGSLGSLSHLLTSPFSQGPSANRQVLWKQLRKSGQGYPVVCPKGPAAHRAPVAATWTGEGLSFVFFPAEDQASLYCVGVGQAYSGWSKTETFVPWPPPPW